MFTFIRKLQQKPERQRRVIAVWTAFLVTLCVFVLWAISFFVRLERTASLTSGGEIEEVSPVRSLSELISSFSGLFSEIF